MNNEKPRLGEPLKVKSDYTVADARRDLDNDLKTLQKKVKDRCHKPVKKRR